LGLVNLKKIRTVLGLVWRELISKVVPNNSKTRVARHWNFLKKFFLENEAKFEKIAREQKVVFRVD